MMLSLRGRIRAFHSCSRFFQSEPPAGTAEIAHKLTGRGKKLPPPKPDLVILNARDSHLFKKVPKYYQKSPGFFVLDPFELESSRKRLLEFKTKVPYDQIISSVHFIKPNTTKVSMNRYKQIQDDIQESYTVPQLKGYIDKYYPNLKGYKSNITKTKLVGKILDNCWELEKSDDINSVQDLLIQRVFDLSQTEIFILLTQNTIQQWLRANVQVILIPSEKQLIVRANGPHVQYIEIALSRVFRNIMSEDINMEEIYKLYSQLGETLPLDEIQRLSAVYIQPKEKDPQITDGSEQHEYSMSTLGKKRLTLAKRLMLWAVDYNPAISTFIHSDLNNPAYKWYKSYFTESLPWTQRGKSWLRLKEPKKLEYIESPQETTLDVDTIYDELTKPSKEITSTTDNMQSVTAVNFGHLLYDESTLSDPTPKTIFQTDLPHVREQMMNLPPFGEVDDLNVDVVDRHEYHAQLKFVPSPFNNSEKYLKYSPIEFWIEINEENQGDISTLQVLRILNEQNSLVSLPNEASDLKFLRSVSEPLIDPYNGSDDWLAEQKGINHFLQRSVLDFSGKGGPKIADHVDVKIPGTDEVIRYDYVSLSHRKHLSLSYKDRLLQFAVVEGGALGGRTNEVLVVGNIGDMTKDEFKEFANDSLEFVKQLK